MRFDRDSFQPSFGGWLVAALFLGVVGSGCSSPSANACHVNSDCLEGALCVSGKCKAPNAAVCPDGIDSCADDSECSSGACTAGCCAILCATNADCLDGHVCNAGICEGDIDKSDAGPPPECTSEAECSGAKPHCHVASGKCVECRSGADCDAISRCTPEFACVLRPGRCETNADCTDPSTPACDVPSKECVQCTSNAQCPPNQTCGGDLACHPNQIGCANDSNCSGTPSTPHCEMQSAQCVQCTSNQHCPNGQTCGNDYLCHSIAGGCTYDTDCLAGESCVSGSCVPATTISCETENDCAFSESCNVDYNATNTGFTATCQPANSGGWQGGDYCQYNSDCRSGYCLMFSYNSTDGICVNACTPATLYDDCTYGAVCPKDGVGRFLPGPNGVYESTSTGSDDTWAAAHICWPPTCNSDDDCWGWSADISKDRVCMPWVDITAPNDRSKVTLYCMPRKGAGDAADPCQADSDCGSGKCITWQRGNKKQNGCYGACTSSWDCPGLATCNSLSSITQNGQTLGSCAPDF
jgi:Cys-rich repeat protein